MRALAMRLRVRVAAASRNFGSLKPDALRAGGAVGDRVGDEGAARQEPSGPAPALVPVEVLGHPRMGLGPAPLAPRQDRPRAVGLVGGQHLRRQTVPSVPAVEPDPRRLGLVAMPRRRRLDVKDDAGRRINHGVQPMGEAAGAVGDKCLGAVRVTPSRSGVASFRPFQYSRTARDPASARQLALVRDARMVVGRGLHVRAARRNVLGRGQAGCEAPLNQALEHLAHEIAVAEAPRARSRAGSW